MEVKKIVLFLLSTVAIGCSTSRNTYINRQYHDLTAYYNIYFNGRESLRQASKKAEAVEAQNFDEILPVFAFEYEDVAGLVSADMQITIDKGLKTVEKHSITAKPKRKKNMTREERDFYNKTEYNRFVDDAHLITGKAYIYIHEYDVAEEKLTYVTVEYPKETSVVEAQAYRAILMSRKKQFAEAGNILSDLGKKYDVSRKAKPLISEAFADYYIKQNKYSEAIPHLEEALKHARGKNKKIRFHFILGQLYQKAGNGSKAMEHFTKVLKKNPPYLTTFSAEMAMAYTHNTEPQRKNIRKLLEKALRNEQNKDYHDQIYYAFAKLEETDGNIAKAKEYYRKSISSTGINTRQKGLSYLALAEYHLKDNDYLGAYTCFDSSAILLGADHSLYNDVSSSANKYRKLALNMKIVEREEGLQKMATLSEDDLNDLIDEKLQQAEDEKNRIAEEQQQLEKLKADIDEQLSKGKWYFYNSTSLELGKTDFAMRWGTRKLEDNWRRKNRGIQVQTEYDLESEENETVDDAQSGFSDKEAFMATIPKTDEAKKASDDRILTAMFNIGEAYRDDLNNPDKAAATFESLISRFPSNSLLVDLYVALYGIYTSTGDVDKANYYKNLMNLNYPNNPKILAATDPEYVRKATYQEVSEEADYYTALNHYMANRLGDAYRASVNGLSKYPSGRLIPQFTLLRTLSDSYDGNIVKYRTELMDIVEKYPGNTAAVYAQSILNELEKSEIKWISEAVTPEPAVESNETVRPAQPKPKKATSENHIRFKQQAANSIKSRYSTDDGAHTFVVITDPGTNMNRLRFNILSFNSTNFIDEDYEVRITDFADNAMITVTTLKDRNAAIDYYNAIAADPKPFNNMTANDYVSFIILDSNLELMLNGKSFLDYVEFFNSMYRY